MSHHCKKSTAVCLFLFYPKISIAIEDKKNIAKKSIAIEDKKNQTFNHYVRKEMVASS